MKEYRPTGNNIDSLTNSVSFPNNPDLVDYSPRLEWPTGPDIDTPPPGDSGKNSYGVQLSGYLYPPETADYIFAIASDDNGLLYLSTDSDPAKKQLIAREPEWNPVRDFSGTNRRTLVDEGTADERYVNVSKKIRLTKNVPVYIEALMSEGGGGDSLAIAWRTDGTAPQTGEDLPISGEFLSSIDTVNGPIQLSVVPQSQTVAAGKSVAFSVKVSNGTPPFSYQWSSNGVDIADAITTSYAIPFVLAEHNNAMFSVRVTNPVGSTNTVPAKLTVTSDTEAPMITSILSDNTFTAVRITYSEVVNDAAILSSNYQLSGGLTVTAAAFVTNNIQVLEAATNRMVVVLTTSRQTEGAVYNLTVNNSVKDLSGNAVTPNTGKLNGPVFSKGLLSYRRWLGAHSGVSALTNDASAYATAISQTRTNAETGPQGIPTQNYLALLDGFFIPDVTTNYVFYFSADNDGYMYLSTDATPANKYLIAADVGWQNQRVWTGPGGDASKRRGDLMGGGPFENRSDELLISTRAIDGLGQLSGLIPADQVDPDPWPTVDASGNAVISLVAGQRYYFQLWHVEFEGGRVESTFKHAGEADPVNGTISRMFGDLIGTYVDPSLIPSAPVTPTISVSLNASRVAIITYTGTLERADAVEGPYAAVAGATSPYMPTQAGFFRSRN